MSLCVSMEPPALMEKDPTLPAGKLVHCYYQLICGFLFLFIFISKLTIQQQKGYIKNSTFGSIENAVVIISPAEQAPWPIVDLCLPPSTKLRTMETNCDYKA